MKFVRRPPKRRNPRSPWTGSPKSIKDLHAVELSHAIREKEKRYNVKPVKMQGWTRRQMESYFEEIGRNPARKPVVIYDKLLGIEAHKRHGKFKGQDFYHDFKKNTEAMVLGNPDGSLTIKSTKGKRLWKRFSY
jgi:hypothetical protein